MPCFISFHVVVSQEVVSFMEYYFSTDAELIRQGQCRKVVCDLLLGICFLQNPIIILFSCSKALHTPFSLHKKTY